MSRVAQWIMLAVVCLLGCQPAHAQNARNVPTITVPTESSSVIGRDDNWTKWIELPEVAPYFDLYWRPIDTDFTKNFEGGLRAPRGSSSASGLDNPIEPFSIGNSYLGIQTQKALQDPFRQRADCVTDDECAESLGMPKREAPAKKAIKNFKQPYIGLSVTRPIQ
jgi:hypothetical protein